MSNAEFIVDFCQLTMYCIRLNVHGVKLLQIAGFCDFYVYIFVVCDITTHPFSVWSKFSRDETFADDY